MSAPDILPDESDLEFLGWWEEAEKEDVSEPWELFRVALYGDEAGDFTANRDEISRILRASGYELVLRRVGGERVTP